MPEHKKAASLRYLKGTKSVFFLFALVVLFWTIFDSIMQYISPILIEEHGFSNSMIGFIIGSSSITGVVFDFLICKIFRNISYRRIFLFLFAICAIYPLLLWRADTFWFFIFAMAVWGVYYDLYGFGVFDFIGRYTKNTEHTTDFGLIQIFRALGAMIGPLVVGLVIVENVDWRSFSLGWLFLVVGFLFLLVFLWAMQKRAPINTSIYCEHAPRRKNLFIEFSLWKKLGTKMMPVLCLTFYLFFIEAFFWTLAPLYVETTELGRFGGLFLTAYTLPALIVGWFVGSLTEKFGKKHTAFFGLLIGSALLSLFFVVFNPIFLIIIVFFASFFVSMSLPAINAAYADYICEAPQVEGEIEGLEDSAFNVGYVIGPMLAGVLADVVGMRSAFGILGIMGVILAVVLWLVTPQKIVIKTEASEL